MTIRRFFILFLLIGLFFLPIYAQEESAQIEMQDDDFIHPEIEQEEQAFFIDRSEENIRFIQRLTWEPAEYTFRYEVIIEQIENGVYTEIDRLSVRDPAAEVSLTAGLYRYMVNVYDLLNELSYESDWMYFEIKRAVQPRISSFSPSAFYLDEDTSWVITLRGQNIIPESEIWLASSSTGMFNVFQSNRIIPRSRTYEGSTVRLEFAGSSLTSGEYVIYVRNPGGLDDTTLEKFIITNRKKFDINISLGFAPVIPVNGFLFEDYSLEAPFPRNFFPLGVSLKFNFIPYKFVWGSLGAEATVSYTYLSNEKSNYSTSANFLNTHLSFLYQRYFYNRMLAFNASAGIGLTSLVGFNFEYPVGDPSENVNAHYASFICGLSLSYFFKNPYFVQAGLDYIQVLSAGEKVPLPGFFRPFIGAGIRL